MIRFVIGQDTLPKIITDRIMVCRSWDGSLIYEYHGEQQVFTLQDGDTLVIDHNRVYCTKNKQEQHQEQ